MVSLEKHLINDLPDFCSTMTPAMFDHIQAHPKLALLASAFMFIYAVKVVQRRSKERHLPPGPKGLPFLGNLFQLSTRPWHDYEAWGKEFGRLAWFYSHICA
jgi:hypothetical protein